MLLPAEIAELLTPMEYTRLCGKVEHKFHKAFSVMSVTRTDGNTSVVVELEGGTNETVEI